MDISSERRDKAIKAFNTRIDAANQKAAEREANVRAMEQRRQKWREDWPELADGIITSTVSGVSDNFLQHGSPIILVPITAPAAPASQRPTDKTMQAQLPAAPRCFDVRHKGQVQTLARMQFEIDIPSGKISATTTAKGLAMPPSILMDDFTPEWVVKAAEAVLLAILEGTTTP